MRKIISGENDLLTINPVLASEWDYQKNIGISPNNVSSGSKKFVWWICSKCGLSWEAQIYARNNGNGCPNCGRIKANESRRKKLLRNGENSLFSAHVDCLDEWDIEKNGELTPRDVTPHSGQKVWWKCRKCNYSYYAKICGRVNEHKGCPVCAGVTVKQGINDLKTINPFLASEWVYEKNLPLTPNSITANNNRKIWWKCSLCGNEWQAMVSSRNAGNGCPNCAKAFHTSLPEQILYYYLKKSFPNAQSGYIPNWLKQKGEIDIYIPELSIGIEYDGKKWHEKKEEIDTKKGLLILQHGIHLIRIREIDLPIILDGSICIHTEKIDKNMNYINTVIEKLSSIFDETFNISWKPNVNIDRDLSEIMSSFLQNKRRLSLASVFPELLDDWDYQANGSLRPEQISASSDYRAWWDCKKCHYKWKASIGDRTRGHGCPYCGGTVTRTGYNDFQTQHPEMIGDWSFEKNGELLPDKIASNSNKKIWWKCKKCGGVYEQVIADHARGIGCPICYGRKIVPGINDLMNNNPRLAKEWDYEKNTPLKPENIAPQSNKKVWWICEKCGHSWQATVYSRNGMGRGCPICRSRKSNASDF